jgi:4-amino-4-deoxy-L-arabinose transferase-like glycosyltransferase
MTLRRWRAVLMSELVLLILLALARIALHGLTNSNYGFHRDELAMLDDARYLAWGYVAYPPLTPFIGRIALELFGPSTVGVRFFSGLAQGAALVLTGLIARELGGKRWAVIVAGLAVAVAPVSVAQGALFQYVSFDYLWWVLASYCVVRLLKSGNPKWWLGIGAVIGLGLMTKYTMAFFAVGIALATLLTPARRFLKSPWLWAGVGLAGLIFLPNLIWQSHHGFISLEQLSAIHAHDVQIGRADNFWLDQFLLGANPFTFPLWLAGLYWCVFTRSGRDYRMLGWMYLIPLLLFAIAQGRGYYVAPAYPMLLAAGAVAGERWLARRRPWAAGLLRGAAGAALALGAVFIGALAIPAAPVNSAWWEFASTANSDLKEEIGWPELAQTVREIRDALPEVEQPLTGVLTNNYGEAGAINMYGPALGLPKAISAVNSYWLRGPGDPPPQTLIVVGYQRADIAQHFESCELAGQIGNPFQVKNEEARVPDIFVCRGLRETWADFWQHIQHFG